jgi:hypothetical protein
MHTNARFHIIVALKSAMADCNMAAWSSKSQLKANSNGEVTMYTPGDLRLLVLLFRV